MKNALLLFCLVAPPFGAAAFAQPDAGAPDEAEKSPEPGADKPAPAPADDAPAVETLRKEYLKLRDRLFQSRARAAAVASTIYSSRLEIQLVYESGRFYNV